MRLTSNVPHELIFMFAETIRSFEKRGKPHEMEQFCVLSVLGVYLGLEWLQKNVFQKGPNEFVWLSQPPGDSRLRAYQHLTQLADNLFSLRDQVGFDHLCRRISSGDVRASYFESVAACSVFDCGYTVRIGKEIGKRGQDFDFSGSNSRGVINFEVSEIRSPILTAASIKNKLMSKRDSLPNDKPSVLFIAIPDTPNRKPDFLLTKETFEFFGRTQRINSVVYLQERAIKLKNGMAVATFPLPLFSSRPRHPIDLGFLHRAGHSWRSGFHAYQLNKAGWDGSLDNLIQNKPGQMSPTSFARFIEINREKILNIKWSEDSKFRPLQLR